MRRVVVVVCVVSGVCVCVFSFCHIHTYINDNYQDNQGCKMNSFFYCNIRYTLGTTSATVCWAADPKNIKNRIQQWPYLYILYATRVLEYSECVHVYRGRSPRVLE